MGHKGIWKSPATSFWFVKFVAGISTRIGQTRDPILVLSVELVSGVEMAIRDDIKTIRDNRERFNLIFFGAYFVTCVISL